MIQRILPYAAAFFGSLALSLVLTPAVRGLNRRLGMIDKPDARRINRVPIPRGGGLAVVLSVFVSMLAIGGFDIRLMTLGIAIAALGYADDKFSLKPVHKLIGQLVIAFLVWFWADLGFADIWPSMPIWLDCLLTVFWIAGAVNAFNLIDGLDGLASGLALIATLGMAGTAVFLGHTNSITFHLAFAGALLGFLRYNYNPASIFLGDSGSMYLGFVLGVMPLRSHTPDSFLVSVGVPLLAMGVPIFDTALAILRRSIRHLLRIQGDTGAGNDQVMTADTDHVHHRLLRSTGLNQRKAAWILYAAAFALTAFGLVSMSISSRRAGLWLIAVTVGAAVIFRDISNVELYDASRLLGELAHNGKRQGGRRLNRLVTPLLILFDLAALTLVFFAVNWIAGRPITRSALLVELPIRATAIFVASVAFHVYSTAWSRAMVSNYVRMFIACLLGAIVGTAGVYYAPNVTLYSLRWSLILYTLLPFLAMLSIRVVRMIVRDLFYALDCRRIMLDAGTERILAYGAGLRYRAFRRELVRSAAANNRVIVGLIDDDTALRGKYIGGIRILGTLPEAPRIIAANRIDAVVITSELTEEWLRVVRETLGPTGVKLTQFSFSEKAL